MPAKNIECQIAEGQIGRYLSGDRFSPEAVKQLEGHIAECSECQSLLAERRAALVAILGNHGDRPVKAVVEVPKAKPANPPSPFADALREQLATGKTAAAEAKAPEPKTAKPKVTEPKSGTKPTVSKPVILSAALAAVLVGMSYVSKGSGNPFGPKAAAMLASNPSAPAVPAATPTPTIPTSVPAAATPSSSPAEVTSPAPAVAQPTPSIASTAPTPVPTPQPSVLPAAPSPSPAHSQASLATAPSNPSSDSKALPTAATKAADPQVAKPQVKAAKKPVAVVKPKAMAKTVPAKKPHVKAPRVRVVRVVPKVLRAHAVPRHSRLRHVRPLAHQVTPRPIVRRKLTPIRPGTGRIKIYR